MGESAGGRGRGSQGGHTDVAALSAGVIAVAVTTIVTPGRYGGLGTIMAITLLILIISYSWDAVRTFAHSLAFSAVIALVGMQVVGVVIEAAHSEKPIRLFIGSDYGYAVEEKLRRAEIDRCLSKSPAPGQVCAPEQEIERQLAEFDFGDKTRVDGRWLWLSWLVIFVLTLCVDRGVGPLAGRWWPNSLAARKDRAINAGMRQ